MYGDLFQLSIAKKANPLAIGREEGSRGTADIL